MNLTVKQEVKMLDQQSSKQKLKKSLRNYHLQSKNNQDKAKEEMPNKIKENEINIQQINQNPLINTFYVIGNTTKLGQRVLKVINKNTTPRYSDNKNFNKNMLQMQSNVASAFYGTKYSSKKYKNQIYQQKGQILSHQKSNRNNHDFRNSFKNQKKIMVPLHSIEKNPFQKFIDKKSIEPHRPRTCFNDYLIESMNQFYGNSICYNDTYMAENSLVGKNIFKKIPQTEGNDKDSTKQQRKESLVSPYRKSKCRKHLKNQEQKNFKLQINAKKLL